MHYPTDINLLLDAVRKSIETSAQLCKEEGLSDWRQSAYNIKQLKKAYRRVQRLKRSTSKDAAKRQARQAEIEQAYRDYLQLAEQFLARARDTRAMLHIGYDLPNILLTGLDTYIAHGERQIDQIRRRVLQGQRIPHDEKVFSIFEPHTECLLGAAGKDAAASEEVTELTASRAAVAAACRVSRGIAIGTDARSGAYGCISRGGWISCDETGLCLGAQNDPAPDARDPESAPAWREPLPARFRSPWRSTNPLGPHSRPEWKTNGLALASRALRPPAS